MIENNEKNNFLIPQFEKSSYSDIKINTKNQVQEILEVDNKENQNLFDDVLKNRILAYLLNGDKNQRAENQTIFFKMLAKNILTLFPEEFQKLPYRKVLQKYYLGKARALRNLDIENKPLGEVNLDFLLDIYLKDKNILEGIVDCESQSINNSEIIKTIIKKMTVDEQIQLLEEIYSKLDESIKGVKLTEGISNLVGGFDNQTERRTWKDYIISHSNGRINKDIVDRISIILESNYLLGEQTINSKLENKDIEQNINLGNLADGLEEEIQKYTLLKELTSSTDSSKQISFFNTIAEKIGIMDEASIPSILYKIYWEKRDNQIVKLNQLYKKNIALSEQYLGKILDKILKNESNSFTLKNIVNIELKNHDIIRYIISKMTIDEQQKLLSKIFETLGKYNDYKNILNRGSGKISAGIKYFIKPERYGECPYKINDQIYSLTSGKVILSSKVESMLAKAICGDCKVFGDLRELFEEKKINIIISEKARLEKEKIEMEKAKKLKLEKEKARLEKEKLKIEKAKKLKLEKEKARLEKEKLKIEKAKRLKLEKEKARLEKEKLKIEKAKKLKLEKEKARLEELKLERKNIFIKLQKEREKENYKDSIVIKINNEVYQEIQKWSENINKERELAKKENYNRLKKVD